MMMLFLLSITPKIFLHDLIANHKDSYYSLSSTETQVTKKGIHCDCNSLVVVSPFLNESNSVSLTPPDYFVKYNCTLCNSFYSVNSYVFSLRGPPNV